MCPSNSGADLETHGRGAEPAKWGTVQPGREPQAGGLRAEAHLLCAGLESHLQVPWVGSSPLLPLAHIQLVRSPQHRAGRGAGLGVCRVPLGGQGVRACLY